MTHPQANRSAASGADSPGGAAAGADLPADRVDETVAAVLLKHSVTIERLGARAFCFKAVPLPEPFSKAGTNVLIQMGAGAGAAGTGRAYVDSDLQYGGSDRLLVEAFRGRTARGWRGLRIPPLPGPVVRALCAVLKLLGSPIAPAVREASLAAGASADGGADPTPMLDAVAEPVTGERAEQAYAGSFRKDLADRLAVAVTRTGAARAAVLWGPPGVGLDHLMLASAWPLLNAGRVESVLRVSAARVAVGRIFHAEIDAALMALLGEAAGDDKRLLLIQGLDVCITGSPQSRALLCEALDRGVAFLATVSSAASLAKLRQDAALARRLLAVRVEPPRRGDVLDALEQLAGESPIEVAPATMQVALSASEELGQIQPAGAIGLLAAAIAQARWRKEARQVSPDDVFAVPPSEWPEDIPEAPGKD